MEEPWRLIPTIREIFMIFKLFYVLNKLFNLENYILCENNNIIVLILGHVHWNVANYHNKIHSFKRCIQNEYTVDSYVFRRQEKLQFCVQVFVTVIEHRRYLCAELWYDRGGIWERRFNVSKSNFHIFTAMEANNFQQVLKFAKSDSVISTKEVIIYD